MLDGMVSSAYRLFMATAHVGTEQVGNLVELLSTLGIKSVSVTAGNDVTMVNLVMSDDDGVRSAQASLGLPPTKSSDTGNATVLSSYGPVGSLFIFVDHVTAKVAA